MMVQVDGDKKALFRVTGRASNREALDLLSRGKSKKVYFLGVDFFYLKNYFFDIRIMYLVSIY